VRRRGGSPAPGRGRGGQRAGQSRRDRGVGRGRRDVGAPLAPHPRRRHREIRGAAGRGRDPPGGQPPPRPPPRPRAVEPSPSRCFAPCPSLSRFVGEGLLLGALDSPSPVKREREGPVVLSLSKGRGEGEGSSRKKGADLATRPRLVAPTFASVFAQT